ncbi:low molecular weight phosphatase family protein [Paraoerskovia sediminicola]|uniref:protein-tyrosine-phosphatase n=1 Tax=Paraoerskovia sediminicola TaxID=1138587 RepID=A0ABN6XG23_9CELL|nr:low molecular weight phosphatase family protein [Paraoerskovia sediminicola]BDZ42750.1 low molecular weight phosphatase family protein [Paraoerskovia sediminicola]
MPVSILAVCTGNICRSPALERLLRRDLGPAVRVVSAGTQARATSPIDGPMVALLDADGLPTARFSARQLNESSITNADLILTATAAHRSAVVRLVPAAVRRTFTLLELAMLVSTIDPVELPHDISVRIAALPAAASAQRSKHLGRHELDIPDPYGRRPRTYRKVYEQIRTAEAEIARVLVHEPAHRESD